MKKVSKRRGRREEEEGGRKEGKKERKGEGEEGTGRVGERGGIVRSRLVYCNNSEQYYDGRMRVM